MKYIKRVIKLADYSLPVDDNDKLVLWDKITTGEYGNVISDDPNLITFYTVNDENTIPIPEADRLLLYKKLLLKYFCRKRIEDYGELIGDILCISADGKDVDINDDMLYKIARRKIKISNPDEKIKIHTKISMPRIVISDSKISNNLTIDLHPLPTTIEFRNCDFDNTEIKIDSFLDSSDLSFSFFNCKGSISSLRGYSIQVSEGNLTFNKLNCSSLNGSGLTNVNINYLYTDSSVINISRTDFTSSVFRIDNVIPVRQTKLKNNRATVYYKGTLIRQSKLIKESG